MTALTACFKPTEGMPGSTKFEPGCSGCTKSQASHGFDL